MGTPLTAYQLRYCPARFIHSKQVPAPLQVLAEALPDWRCQGVINAWLLNELSLPVDYTMPTKLAGLALFAQADLLRTLALLGAILHGQAIRRVLDASTLARVHAVIGVDGHRFCLEQLNLIIGPWPPGWQQPLPMDDLARHLLHAGLQFWLQAIGDVDQGFVRRLDLRLENPLCEQACSMTDAQRPLAQTLCLKITRYASPACLHLLD